MGDIWPYGPPRYTTYAQAVIEAKALGMSENDANIAAAIGTAESSLDLSVINDTPSTGDYSVGVWQINYLGSLYASRSAEFGTPKQLIQGGLISQAKAMHTLWRQSGFYPWSTYVSGAYKQYLKGGTAPGPTPGQVLPPTPAIPTPGKDSWADTVDHSAQTFRDIGLTSQAYGKVFDSLLG